MHLDLTSLMVAGSFIAATCGVFLILAWLQNRDARAMLWWAAADLVLAAGVPLIAGGTLGRPSVIIGIALLNVSPALIWVSARVCNGRTAHPLVAAGGAILWLLAYAMPTVRDSANAQMALNLAIGVFYVFAAAFEFWRGRDEKLESRWPLIVLLTLHGIFFTGGAITAVLGNLPLTGPMIMGSWSGLILFETLAFVVGTSVFVVALSRERNEVHYRIAAGVDALTGVQSRGAFVEEAEQLLERYKKDDSPLGLIVFDLDGFKTINDTLGHGPGDHVLAAFGDTLRKILRPEDPVGRMGGEEFAVMLPGSTIGAAYVIAERIRIAFAGACRMVDDSVVNATVSAGVSAAHPDSTMDSLLKAADVALYRAKLEGRNRVAVADRDRARDKPFDSIQAA